MNIVFDYHPSEPRTELTVNGVIHSDMYDELGAVCNYPIQSWLYPRGPWKGLRKVLNDLARGREMSIEFIGRETDFDDFRDALAGMENTSLSFQAAYEEEEIMPSRLSELRGFINTYPADEIRERFESLIQSAPADGHIRISSADEYARNREVLANSRTVAIFSAEAYRKVAMDLRRLLRENFMRPVETILVLAKNSREKEALIEETSGIGVTVTLDPEYDETRLSRKYGVPESTAAMYDLCMKLAEELDKLVSHAKDLKQANRRIQQQQQQAQELGLRGCEEDEKVFDDNAREIKWMTENRSMLEGLAARLKKK